MNEYELIFRDTCEYYLNLLYLTAGNTYENKSKEEIKTVVDLHISNYIKLSLNEEEFDNLYADINIHVAIELKAELSFNLSVMSYIRATRYYARDDYKNACKHINDALFQLGILEGYYTKILSCGRSSEQMSKAGSSTEKAKNSQRIKEEIIDYLSENAKRYPWTSIDDVLPELIDMLTEKAKTTSKFTINPNTIRASIKKWSRSSSESESDHEFQEHLAEIFPPQ